MVPFLRLQEPTFWAQMKRTLRRSFSRQNSFKETDPNVVFLTSVQNNMMVSGILKGIQIAMEEEGQSPTNLKQPEVFHFNSIEIIDQADFRQHDRRSFSKIKSIPSKSVIKAYAQQTFRQLRQMQGIQEKDIMESLMPQNNRLQIFKTNKDMIKGISTNKGGRSDSFFFFTQDQKYLVKTMTGTELNVLLSMLEGYAEHMMTQMRKGIEPILAKIQGVYQFNMDSGGFINIMIMTNSSQLQDDRNIISHRFDLKGSKINRRALPRSLKDVDLTQICMDNVMKDLDI